MLNVRRWVAPGVGRGSWASGAVATAAAVPAVSDASLARVTNSFFIVLLERPHLRRDRFDRLRLQVDRLVRQPVAFAEPERVLHPFGVVAAVRRDRIVD